MDEAKLAAQPMAFFYHDVSASRDIKLKKLRKRRGMAGIGYWWVLCEYLAFVSSHIAGFQHFEDKQNLAEEIFMTVEEAEDFLKELAELGLINKELFENGKVSSDRMCANAQYRAKKSSSGSSGGKAKAGA